MSAQHPERDAEIRALARQGRSTTYLADRFGLSLARVSQIIHGRDRAKERKGGPCVTAAQEVRALQPIVFEPAPGGTRPRLRRNGLGGWDCTDGIVTRAAKTFQAAYHRWLGAALLQAQQKPVEAFTPPAAVKPVRKAPNGRGKSIEAVKPRPPAPVAVDATQPVEPYAGPVTTLPGTAPRRALSLSPALQLNGARAAAVQPRMISIAGSAAREDAA